MTAPNGGDDSNDGSILGDVRAGASAVAGGLAAAGGASPGAAAGVGDIATQAVGWGQTAVKGLDPTAAIAAGLAAMTAPLMEFGKVADWVFKLSLPTTWIRVCAWIGAAFFLTFGIILLARELRTK